MFVLRKNSFIELKRVFIILSWSEKGVVSFVLFFLSKFKLRIFDALFNKNFNTEFSDYFSSIKFKNLRVLKVSEFFSLNG